MSAMEAWIYGGMAAAVAAAGLTYVQIRKRGGRKGKVTNLTAYRKLTQKCSYCKKKADKLIFYSNSEGQVVGLCKACKPKAERQNMLPI